MKHPTTEKEALRLSKDLSPLVREEAMRSLEKLERWPLLRIVATNSGRLDIREFAVHSLASRKDQGFASTALKLAQRNDLDPEFQAELLSSLPAFFGHKRAPIFKVLEKILGNPAVDPAVRHAAVLSYLRCQGDLGFIGQTLQKLSDYIKEKPERARKEHLVLRACVHGLRACTRVEHRALLQRLLEEDWLHGDLARIVHRSLDFKSNS
jgi:hypothetical protein